MALLDAGRGEFYCRANGLEQMLRREEAMAAMDLGTAATCEVRVAEALGERVRVVREPGGEEMLRLVLERVRAGEWSDVATVDANYLRRTDAELAAERR